MLHRTIGTCTALMVAIAVGSPVAHAHAIMLGQVDDFQDGTLQGWQSHALPVNVADGGPAGLGDRCLGLTSDGGTGDSGLLRASNYLRQWSGDFVAAGVNGVEMDLRNLGPTPLEIRVVLSLGNYGGYTSTVSFPLPANGEWYHAAFGLTVADLTFLGGGYPDFDQGMRGVGGLTIRHQAGAPSALGTPIASQIDIDNIRAVPEPCSLVLTALGGLAMARFPLGRSRVRRGQRS